MKVIECMSLFVCLLILSCSRNPVGEEKPNDTKGKIYSPDSIAIAFNDSAMNLLSQVNPFDDSLDIEIYEEALAYINKAIMIDSLYDLAYSNKVDILKNLNRYDDAISTLKRANYLIDDYVEALSGMGFLYHKIGKIDSANLMYEEALKGYRKRLEINPNTIDNQTSLAFILLFARGKREALDEIDLIIRETGSQEAKDFRLVIESFELDHFIKNY